MKQKVSADKEQSGKVKGVVDNDSVEERRARRGKTRAGNDKRRGPRLARNCKLLLFSMLESGKALERGRICARAHFRKRAEITLASLRWFPQN